MNNKKSSEELLTLLNDAIAREIQVSLQYMLQHAIYNGRSDKSPKSKTHNFVASHAPIILPGKTLKKIAITEMRHTEKIAERVSNLGRGTADPPGAIQARDDT